MVLMPHVTIDMPHGPVKGTSCIFVHPLRGPWVRHGRRQQVKRRPAPSVADQMEADLLYGLPGCVYVMLSISHVWHVVFRMCLGRLQGPAAYSFSSALLRSPRPTPPRPTPVLGLPQVKFAEFVKQHLGEWPGPILEAESGRPVGAHAGYWFYTVGQRGGIKLPGGPW